MDIIRVLKAESGAEQITERLKVESKAIWHDNSVQNEYWWIKQHASKLFVIEDKWLMALQEIIDKGLSLLENFISRGGIWCGVGDRMAEGHA